MNRTGQWIWLSLLLIAMLAAACLLWLTPRGPGISPDSTVYVESAQSLSGGQGFAVDGAAVTHFPPLYPLLLAFVALFLRGDVLLAARIVGALFLAINLILAGWLVYLASGRRLWVAGLAVLFAASSEPLLELHAWAWSEPLFVALALTSVLAMVRYVEQPRWSALMISALAMGLALSTRYIGIGFLPAGALVIYLARPRRDRWMGLQTALVWLGIAVLPLLLLFLRNALASGAVTDRGLAFHPAMLVDFTLQLASTISRTIALDALLARVGAAVLLLILVYLLFPFESWSMHLREVDRRSPEFSVPFSGLAFCLSYLVFLVISLSFLDASTPIDARILAPVLFLLIIVGFPALRTLSDRLNKPHAWSALVGAAILLMLARLPGEIPVLAGMRTDGLGYTSRFWMESPTVLYAHTLPAGARIYSNAPDVLRWLNGRIASRLPATASSLTLQPNPQYQAQLDQFCRDIAGGGSYLVYFDTVQPWNLPGIEALRSKCDLPLLTELNDGAVYGGP